MIEDSDEEDDFGRAIANPGGRGVRRYAHQHNHWGNDEYKLKNGFLVSLELDLEHYVVPATSTIQSRNPSILRSPLKVGISTFSLYLSLLQWLCC